MARALTIGRLAKQAGVNVETVRYYERIGIIRQPVTPVEGYRVYPPADIDRIRFIKHAQELGFSLSEVQELLDLGEAQCDEVQHKAQVKLDQIDAQIADLQALRATLSTLIDQCQLAGQAHCPIVETLSE